jgi:hypothetical protein
VIDLRAQLAEAQAHHEEWVARHAQLNHEAITRAERAEAERDAMRQLLADKTYIQCKADYNRGHLSHANYLNERERAALNPSNAGEKT